MKTLIWDLDGTLLNSYPVIVGSLLTAYQEQGVSLKKEEVYAYVIRYSAGAFMDMMQDETGIPSDRILKRYFELSESRIMEITAFREARQTLDVLASQGAIHHVFTHRGWTTEPILKHIQLWDCFQEVITSQSRFPRKPEPDALLYLVKKYRLSPKDTFYVGDRNLDMDCAKNAGIPGILFKPEGSYCEPNGSESFIVKRLLEIPFLEAVKT